MKLRRNIIGTLFTSLLLMIIVGRSSGAAPGCPSVFCVFLPEIPVTAPVTITEDEFGGSVPLGLRIWGEVRNTSARPVYEVLIEAQLFDSSDQLLRTVTTSTDLPMIPPGEVIPFDIHTGISPPNQVNRYELQIVGWSWESDQLYHSLAVTSIQTEFTIGSPGAAVTVTVQNNSSWPLKDVRGVAWSIYGLRTFGGPETIVEVLCPGEEVSFINQIQIMSSQQSSLKAAAQGIPANQPYGLESCQTSP